MRKFFQQHINHAAITAIFAVLIGTHPVAWSISTFGMPAALTNGALQSMKKIDAPFGILRYGVTFPGDSPTVTYSYNSGKCPQHNGAGDVGSCNPAADGGSWRLAFTSAGLDILLFGADPTATVDSSAALQDAAIAAGSNHSDLIAIGGSYLANTLSMPSGVTLRCMAGAPSLLGQNASFILNANNTYLMADAAWVNGVASGFNNGGGFRDCVMDGGFFCGNGVNCGSLAAPITGTIAVVIKTCYNCILNGTIQDSDGFLVLRTPWLSNGVKGIAGQANNIWQLNLFSGLEGGYTGIDSGANILADFTLDNTRLVQDGFDTAILTASQSGNTLNVTVNNGYLCVGEFITGGAVPGEFITAVPGGSKCVFGDGASKGAGAFTVSASGNIGSSAMLANGYAGACASGRIDNGSVGNLGNILTLTGCTGVQFLNQTFTLTGSITGTKIVGRIDNTHFYVDTPQNVAAGPITMSKIPCAYEDDRAAALFIKKGTFFSSNTPYNCSMNISGASSLDINARFDSSNLAAPGNAIDISITMAGFATGRVQGDFLNGMTSLPSLMSGIEKLAISTLAGHQVLIDHAEFYTEFLPASVITPISVTGGCCVKVSEAGWSGDNPPYPTSNMDVWARLPDWNTAAGLVDDSGDNLSFGAGSLCIPDGLGSFVHFACHIEMPGSGTPTHNFKMKVPVQARAANNLGWASAGVVLPESGSSIYFVQALFSSPDIVMVTNTNGIVANSTINSLPTPKIDFAFDVPVR